MPIHAEDLAPVALMGAMAAIGAGNSARSVIHWLQLLIQIVRTQDAGAMLPLRVRQEENRERILIAWTRSCSPWKLVGLLQIKRARSAQGNSNLWGPVFWQGLHNLSAMFAPGAQRDRLLEAFRLLPYVLPCRQCRLHAQDNLRRMRNVLSSARDRAEFVNAVVELHNFITSQLKPAGKRLLYPHPLSGNLRRVSLRTALDSVQDHAHSSIAQARGTADCGCKA